jgi:HSP20 family molecular chaperone IbpA
MSKYQLLKMKEALLHVANALAGFNKENLKVQKENTISEAAHEKRHKDTDSFCHGRR